MKEDRENLGVDKTEMAAAVILWLASLAVIAFAVYSLYLIYALAENKWLFGFLLALVGTVALEAAAYVTMIYSEFIPSEYWKKIKITFGMPG